MITRPLYPLEPGGSAHAEDIHLGAAEGLTIEDRTAAPRFGLKGPGSADWLAANGVALPAINQLARAGGLVVLRLGANDITLLGDPGAPDALDAVRRRWDMASAPKGYSSWREESWAWLRLSGPRLNETLARHCALDLRPGRFADDAIGQTRFAHVEAVLVRAGAGFDVLFDITATAGVLRDLRRAHRGHGHR